MKRYTDGTLIIRVGTKYAHIINKAGSEMGKMDKDHFFHHAKGAGFTEIVEVPND